MKIYLIGPRNPESFWTFDAILPALGKKCLYPNLSLPTVAALTPDEHEVVLCDENVTPVDLDMEADIVGLTGYIIHQERMLELAAEFRKRGRFVVAGGPLASLCPERLRGKVDVVFVDEAEATWPEFLRDFGHGRHRAEYVAGEKPSLEDSPVPRFDLLEVGQYQSMTIQFARGCPFRCEFCDIIVMYGRRPRTKRVEQVLREIETVYALGAQSVFIVDDNFIGNKREAKRLLGAIVAWQEAHGYPLEFNTEVTLNVAQDEELLDLMRRANFPSVFIGVETPRVASLEETHKLQNLREDIVGAVHRIQGAGIEVMAGMIIGFDHDDETSFEEQLRFLEQARIPVSMSGLLQAPPKTALHARMQSEGRLLADCGGDQFQFTNIVPVRLTLRRLYEGYRDLLREVYAYDNYRRRVMDLVLHKRLWHGDARSDRPYGARQVWRLVRELVLTASPQRLGFTVRIAVETLLRRPQALRDALTLVVLHRHLHEYTEKLSARLDAQLAGLPATGGD